jgi:Fe-S oxidoreductase
MPRIYGVRKTAEEIVLAPNEPIQTEIRVKGRGSYTGQGTLKMTFDKLKNQPNKMKAVVSLVPDGEGEFDPYKLGGTFEAVLQKAGNSWVGMGKMPFSGASQHVKVFVDPQSNRITSVHCMLNASIGNFGTASVEYRSL